MTDLDVYKRLPPSIAYKWSAFHLYRIGLSADNMGNNQIKRKWFNKPIFMFAVFMIYLIQRIVCLFLNDNDWQMFALFGDFSYFLGVKVIFNIFFILINLLDIL